MSYPGGHNPAHYRPSGTSNSQVAETVRRMMARHMRHDHGMTMAGIQRELGISRKTLWEKRCRLGIP